MVFWYENEQQAKQLWNDIYVSRKLRTESFKEKVLYCYNDYIGPVH